MRSLRRHLVRWHPWAVLATSMGVAACATVATSGTRAPDLVSGTSPRGVAEMQSQSPADFAFAVPAGTRYVRTERRRFEAMLEGKRAEREVSELRWDVASHPSSFDTTVFDQRLVFARVVRDGKRVVEGAPAGADLQIVVDSGANVQDVRGIDQAARALVSLAGPGERPIAERLFSPQDLRALVLAHHQLLAGDVAFRPARPGTTWIVPARPGGDALLRRYTVEGLEPCGSGTCARVRVGIQLEPRLLENIARQVVEHADAGLSGPLSVQDAHYVMTGTLLLQPATLLSWGAKFTETGRARVVDGAGRSRQVEVRATTEDTYDHAPTAVATDARR